MFFSPSHPHTSPPPTTYTNFTVTNTSVLPENVSQALKSLDQELKEGDLTERGYLKRKVHLLEPFKHLLVAAGNKSNAHTAATATTQQHSVEGGRGRGDSVERRGWGGGGEKRARNLANGKSYLYCLSSQVHTPCYTTAGHRGPSHVELFEGVQQEGVGRRRLMAYEEEGVSDEEWEMAEWVARGKWKELTRDEDIQR